MTNASVCFRLGARWILREQLILMHREDKSRIYAQYLNASQLSYIIKNVCYRHEYILKYIYLFLNFTCSHFFKLWQMVKKSTPNINEKDIGLLFAFLSGFKSPDWSSVNKTKIPWTTVSLSPHQLYLITSPHQFFTSSFHHVVTKSPHIFITSSPHLLITSSPPFPFSPSALLTKELE